jgi:leucyl aminopeptidase
VPTKAGAQTLSTTFTLPTGSLQAVRAQFRYLGRATSCTTGPYNDHDDLIFAVQ